MAQTIIGSTIIERDANGDIFFVSSGGADLEFRGDAVAQLVAFIKDSKGQPELTEVPAPTRYDQHAPDPQVDPIHAAQNALGSQVVNTGAGVGYDSEDVRDAELGRKPPPGEKAQGGKTESSIPAAPLGPGPTSASKGKAAGKADAKAEADADKKAEAKADAADAKADADAEKAAAKK